MNTKLTLRLDEGLIEQAKAYAAREGRSLSELVAGYFSRLSAPPQTQAEPSPKIYTKTNRLVGALEGFDLDESSYKKHLEKKHK